MITRPIDSFVKYFYDMKPYHTKVLEVVEQYNFFENMNVNMQDAMTFVEYWENTPLCSGTGFGLDFDDDAGFDAYSNCNLGNCSDGGFGLIYNNSDLLVNAPVIGHNNQLSTVTLDGDFRNDTSLQIELITATTIKIRGNVVAKIDPHSLFSIVPNSTLSIVETTANGFYVGGNHKQQFDAVSEFIVLGSTENDNTYNTITANYDPYTNRTFVSTIRLNGILSSSSLGSIIIKSYTKNNGLYNIESVVFDGTFTVITLANGTLPLPLETKHGSVVLRTGLIAPRRVWLYTGISLDEGAVIDDGDIFDNMSESKIIHMSYNYIANTTTLVLESSEYNNSILENLSIVQNIQLRGYSVGSGFDSFKECSLPNPNNISVGFSEYVFIETINYSEYGSTLIYDMQYNSTVSPTFASAFNPPEPDISTASPYVAGDFINSGYT